MNLIELIETLNDLYVKNANVQVFIDGKRIHEVNLRVDGAIQISSRG